MGQRDRWYTSKASGLAEAHGSLREPFDPKCTSSSSPSQSSTALQSLEERISLEQLPAALSPALLFRSWKSPGKGGHRVSLAPHH